MDSQRRIYSTDSFAAALHVSRRRESVFDAEMGGTLDKLSERAGGVVWSCLPFAWSLGVVVCTLSPLTTYTHILLVLSNARLP